MNKEMPPMQEIKEGEIDSEAEEKEKLKAKIKSLNEEVQQNLIMDKYGKEHGFNKEETYAWVEQQIKEAEDKIHGLEKETEKDETAREREDLGINDWAWFSGWEDLIKYIKKQEEKGEGGETPGPVTEQVPGPEPVPVNPEGPKPMPKLPEQAPEIFRKEYETEKKKGGVWGWIKERFKGFATMGFWEVRQAERFRSQTKEESTELAKEAERIQRTEGLSKEEAEEEAYRMRSMAEASGEKTRNDYERFSREITTEKMNANTMAIEEIMKNSVNRLEDRLQKYKNQWGGSVINAANIEKYQENLRDKLLALQRGYLEGREGATPIEAEPETFKKTIRESLDPKYWSRYVYGGTELVIDALLLNAAAKALVAKLLIKEGAPIVTSEATKLVGKEIIKETTYFMKKGDTLWGIAKSYLMQNGVANPSNLQIMEGAKMLATSNHVGVNVWGLAGAPLDTMMPVGSKVALGAFEAAIPKIAALGAI
jgi:nucleoid-associated protein YgaU